MKGTIKLRKSIKSKKFGIIFPANKTLNCFVNHEMRIFVEHFKYIGVFAAVNVMNQYDFKLTK